ncbi:MAG: dUTP diphosphatase [Clostridiales bacterium]|nr:dUTP diphosphatase [Clostridiales bacterium]
MNVKIVNKRGQLPSYETSGSAGMDLRACIDEPVIIESGRYALVPTGISIALPEGYEAQVRARSGLAVKHGIGLVNGIGTIDSDYRGEIKVALINLGDKDFIINDGDRIAQMVIARYEKIEWEVVDNLPETTRGEGGFGHTGTR